VGLILVGKTTKFPDIEDNVVKMMQSNASVMHTFDPCFVSFPLNPSLLQTLYKDWTYDEDNH
jgi:hypothetical protein